MKITSVLCLRVSISPTGEYEITTELGSRDQKDEQKNFDVLFVKRSGIEAITPKNINDRIDVHTQHGSPLTSLLNSLQGMWCPTLLDNPDITKNVPPRIRELLGELKATLSSSVGLILLKVENAIV